MNYPLTFSPLTLSCRGRQTVFRRPLVMGILNATDDSFYDGGKYNTPDALLAHARQLLSEGADLLDLGVMSSRPGASMPTPQEETARLVPLVKLLRSELPDAILSVDTCVNDISGGQLDPDMLPTAASLRVPYILMHMRGTPATMQLPENTRYNDIVDDLSRYFDEKLDTLHRLGAADVWLDPGLGFAKTVEQNHELLHRLPELIARFPEHPMLVALSNKSMITKRLASFQNQFPEEPSPLLPDSELGTLALNTVALMGGASILRVHTPRPTRVAIQLLYPES